MANFIHVITTYSFMQRAFLAAVLIGFIVGIVGVLMILRGLSLMGDAIGHSVLPGVAMSHLLGLPHAIGAATFGIIASLLIGFITEKTTLKKDTVLGLVFSSFFALGIVMIAQIRTMTDLHHILFGNILTIRQADVENLMWLAGAVLLLVLLFYKELLLTSFDETMATVYGVKTKLIHYLFLFVLTVVIVFAIQLVGVILIVAMMITPAATAYLLTHHMHRMLIVSTLLSVSASMIGVFLSLQLNVSAGSTIVLTSFVIFLITFLLAPKKGWVINLLK
ncbi:MAG: metal ABC transporter permease [Defluviitaleaceae bacterium]|nr:metal ABC transporter permease [Defluviitaleaceae bacterium]